MLLPFCFLFFHVDIESTDSCVFVCVTWKIRSIFDGNMRVYKRSTRCEPMKPAPPVTKIRLRSKPPFVLSLRRFGSL